MADIKPPQHYAERVFGLLLIHVGGIVLGGFHIAHHLPLVWLFVWGALSLAGVLTVLEIGSTAVSAAEAHEVESDV
jgi:hypothetical protein